MATALSIFGVAFAAFCVWLTVRIVNRRERWAKWALTITLLLPVLYVASFGPACWWFRVWRHGINRGHPYAPLPAVYWPFGCLMSDGPYPVRDAIGWYANRNGAVILSTDWNGEHFIVKN